MNDKYPGFVWAKSIGVNVRDAEIEISGVAPITQEDLQAAPDPLRAYRKAISRHAGAKRQGKNSPHVQFANADHLEEKIAFLKTYGPVVVSSFRTEERSIPAQESFDFGLSETVIHACQNLTELENERLAYRSALELISELRRNKNSDFAAVRKSISTIVRSVSIWPSQWERERSLRAAGLGFAQDPLWKLTEENLRHLELWMWRAMREPSTDPIEKALMGSDPVLDGHNVICELVNAFAPVVYPWGHSPVEAPYWDLAAGIRPVLYYMLRREYLSGTGIGICRNSDCRRIFEIERSGQEFCSDECSRLQRQREYWSARGKKLRKRRLMQRESSADGKRRNSRRGKQR